MTKQYQQPLKSANMAEVVQEWYASFIAVDQEVLFELILAANYMDIKPLLDLTCATVASMIKGKTPEEIRKTFNIVNDFTPEEEAQVARGKQVVRRGVNGLSSVAMLCAERAGYVNVWGVLLFCLRLAHLFLRCCRYEGASISQPVIWSVCVAFSNAPVNHSCSYNCVAIPALAVLLICTILLLLA